MEELRDRTIRNLYYQGVLTAATAIAGTISLVVLARVLSPAEFGRAMFAFLIIQSAEMVSDFGLLAAMLSQREEVGASLGAAATLRLLLAAAASAVVFTVGTLAANALGVADVANLLVPLAIVPLLSGLGFASQVTLRLELDFGRLSLAQAGGTIGSPAAQAVLALLGYGVWAIIWGAIVGYLLQFILLLVVRPVRWRPTFHPGAFKGLLRFGSRLTGAAVLADAFSLSAAALVGTLAGPAALGAYLLGLRIGMLVPLRALSIVSEVLLPTLSRIRLEGGDMNAAYLEGVRAVSIPSSLANFAGVALVGPGVLLIAGAQWELAVPAVALLALWGVLNAHFQVATPYLLAMGQPGANLRQTAIVLVLMLAIGPPALFFFGLLGFLVLLLFLAGFTFVYLGAIVANLGGPGALAVSRAAWPAVITCACAAAAAYLVSLAAPSTVWALVLGGLAYMGSVLAVDRVAFKGLNVERVRHFARVALRRSKARAPEGAAP